MDATPEILNLSASSEPSLPSSEFSQRSSPRHNREFSASIVLNMSKESGEGNPRSKLVQFIENREGQLKHMILPMFFEEGSKKLSNVSTHAASSVLDANKKVTTNSTNHEAIEEEPKDFFENEQFEFEQAVVATSTEFGEFPTVAYCNSCNKETVTAVKLEKERRNGTGNTIEYYLCWCLPAWLSRHRSLVHRCSQCNTVLSKLLV